jgi:epoxyqueuosine reductase
MQIRHPNETDFNVLAGRIRLWARELGFQSVGISDTDLADAEPRLHEWLARGRHGAMDYMANHADKRARPATLVPGVLRVISLRMDYLPPAVADSWAVLADGERAFVSRYALGRDYHKLIRKRLALLADRIRAEVADFDGRVFTDSAPVMEVEFARKASLGWRGKHTLLLSREAGSWFFLGEIFINLPLPVDQPLAAHCGSCTSCLEVCPTRAIVAPYQLDARRCISYLTIELKGSIPVELRSLMGNRIYGCDDCQLVCPWNRFARITAEGDFHARHGLDDVGLLALFSWDEITFRTRMAGSPIYRIGYEQWQRNLAVALGNAPKREEIVAALTQARATASALVLEHLDWALAQQLSK